MGLIEDKNIINELIDETAVLVGLITLNRTRQRLTNTSTNLNFLPIPLAHAR